MTASGTRKTIHIDRFLMITVLQITTVPWRAGVRDLEKVRVKTKGAPTRPGRPLRGVTWGLVVQLQSELDLPRVIRSVAGRADLTKVRVVEVGGSGDGDDAVAAETRSVKIGAVGTIEDFRPELEAHALVERGVFEDGEVQTLQ